MQPFISVIQHESLHLLYMRTHLEPIYNSFSTVYLDQMGKAKLMDRFDTKYVVLAEYLPLLLERVKDSYNVLSINGLAQQPYKTSYYDTPSFDMYLAHHNRKLHRYKLRIRNYESSNIHFLEIKHKTNKGRTQKKRIQTDELFLEPKDYEMDFLKKNLPEYLINVDHAMDNHFYRTTLVQKDYSERITIDIMLSFSKGDFYTELPSLAIIELKQGQKNAPSVFADALNSYGLKPSRFSKYCTGIYLTQQIYKYNRFKLRYKQINKLVNKGGYPDVFIFN